MMKLDDALANVTLLGLDTSPFIYFIERHAVYVDLMRETFRRVETGVLRACSSIVTLTEVLRQPLQQSNHARAAKYRDQLRMPNSAARDLVGAGLVPARFLAADAGRDKLPLLVLLDAGRDKPCPYTTCFVRGS